MKGFPLCLIIACVQVGSSAFAQVTSVVSPLLTSVGAISPTQAVAGSTVGLMIGYTAGTTDLRAIYVIWRDQAGHELQADIGSSPRLISAGEVRLPISSSFFAGDYQLSRIMFMYVNGQSVATTTFQRSGAVDYGVPRVSGQPTQHQINFASADFSISGATTSVTSPVLTGVGSILNRQGSGGDTLRMRITYTPGSTDLRAIYLFWRDAAGHEIQADGGSSPQLISAGEVLVPITSNMFVGDYQLSRIMFMFVNGQTVASTTFQRNGTIDYGVPRTAIQPATHSLTFSAADFSIVPPTAPRIAIQPSSVRSVVGERVELSVVATGAPVPNYQWRKNQAAILGAQSASYIIPSASLGDAGTYDVVVTNNAGSVTSSSATIRIDTPPIITSHPESPIVALASEVILRVSAMGTEPMTFQWLKNGTPLQGVTTPTLLIQSATVADAGVYSCIVTNSLGQTTSNAGILKVAPATALSNLSVRTSMAAGQTLTVGFVVNDKGVKTVLLRAAGPALNAFGLSGLPNPMLTLYHGSIIIDQNDDWASSLAPVFASVGAFGFAENSRDAALSMTGVQDGNSAVVASSSSPNSTGGNNGTVLVEIYDLSPTATTSRFVNVSARTRVGTGADILIAGFAVSGTGTKRLLIRGIGPALAAFGVSGALTDPRLEVFGPTGKIGENDDWDATLTATFANVGAFAPASGSRDSALVVTVSGGASYTALVSGVSGGTGEALVEVYELP